MANGDAAAAAGLDTVPPSGPTGKARMGYDWINYALDRVVTWVVGTAQLAAGAVTTAVLADSAVTTTKVADGAITRTKFGPKALSTSDVYLADNVTQLQGFLASEQSRLNTVQARANQGFISGSGDLSSGGGRLHSNGSRAWTVTTNYASAYLNSDGWLGITPSARRLKQDLTPQAYTLDQVLAIQVTAYRIRAAVAADPDAPGEVGVIAEDLVDAGLEEFVLFDQDGATQSVAYDRLWLVALSGVQQLVHLVRDQADRLETLTGRVAALEGNPA